tara:strand:+ start:2180 stop:2953 length:774 start_codon:yes stop_codon:yes gene_type:complete
MNLGKPIFLLLPCLCLCAVTSLREVQSEESAKQSPFPSDTVPAVTEDGKRILHRDDFSTDTLGKHWGTSSKTASISDGTLKATRDPDGSGKYKVAVEPFKNAAFTFRFRFHDAPHFWFGTDDLSITDTVHGGHLFNCIVATDSITFTDCLSGKYNPEHYPKFKQAKIDKQAKKIKALPPELLAIEKATTKQVPCTIEQDRWYDIKILLEDDTLTLFLNGEKIDSFQSPGFAHPRKDMYRFIMGGTVELDDILVSALD